jgi:dinuclear metal center YbgI/SA1388 family protein
MIRRTFSKPATLRTSCGRFLKDIKRSCQSIVMGMELKEVVKCLNNYAPLSLAESWDNVGLLVEPSTSSHTVDSILLTNDLTESVMDEAVKLNTNMIISYHPPIFTPLKTLTRSTWKERVVLKAIEKRIAIYSPHTAFDVVKGGVNDWLASGLGKATVRPLKNTLTDGNSGTHKVSILVPKDQEKVGELATKIKQADESIDVCVEESL